jgi:heme-degrading monooxygenase HmoA
MIARVWTGRTRADDAQRYAAYLDETGVPDLAKTPGNRGVLVFRRADGDEAEFQVASLWESMEAVRRFAGEDPDRAVYYPLDATYLRELSPTLPHYEMVRAIWTAGLRVGG